jgi:hypothetical protein
MLEERQPFTRSMPRLAPAVCLQERISHDQDLRWNLPFSATESQLRELFALRVNEAQERKGGPTRR